MIVAIVSVISRRPVTVFNLLFFCVLFFAGQEQGLEGQPFEREEHWRGVRGADVRPGPGHHRGHPRVLLELPEECPVRPPESVLRNGRRTQV